MGPAPVQDSQSSISRARKRKNTTMRTKATYCPCPKSPYPHPLQNQQVVTKSYIEMQRSRLRNMKAGRESTIPKNPDHGKRCAGSAGEYDYLGLMIL